MVEGAGLRMAPGILRCAQNDTEGSCPFFQSPKLYLQALHFLIEVLSTDAGILQGFRICLSTKFGVREPLHVLLVVGLCFGKLLSFSLASFFEIEPFRCLERHLAPRKKKRHRSRTEM